MAVHDYPQNHGSLIGLSDTDHHTQYGLPTAGPRASRPSGPWRFGRTYYATDTGEMFFDNGGGWVVVPVTKAQLDAMGINAATLGGAPLSSVKRGWTSSIDAREHHLVLFNGSETNWRRLARLEFNPVTEGVASYTGASLTCEILDGINSWAQNDPRTPIRQQIRITVSNTFTTSNARTAGITGQWSNYDFLRVVKVSDFVYEVQCRPSGSYYATQFKMNLVAQAGLFTIVYDEATDGGPASTGTEYLFGTAAWQGADSRGWQNVNGGVGFAANFGQYAGQTSLGSEWACRYRKVNGIVYVEGLARRTDGTQSGGPVFTLPAGFRPGTGTAMRNTMASGGYVRLDIASAGAVNLVGIQGGANVTDWFSVAMQYIAEN